MDSFFFFPPLLALNCVCFCALVMRPSFFWWCRQGRVVLGMEYQMGTCAPSSQLRGVIGWGHDVRGQKNLTG